MIEDRFKALPQIYSKKRNLIVRIHFNIIMLLVQYDYRERVSRSKVSAKNAKGQKYSS